MICGGENSNSLFFFFFFFVFNFLCYAFLIRNSIKYWFIWPKSDPGFCYFCWWFLNFNWTIYTTRKQKRLSHSYLYMHKKKITSFYRIREQSQLIGQRETKNNGFCKSKISHVRVHIKYTHYEDILNAFNLEMMKCWALHVVFSIFYIFCLLRKWKSYFLLSRVFCSVCLLTVVLGWSVNSTPVWREND